MFIFVINFINIINITTIIIISTIIIIICIFLRNQVPIDDDDDFDDCVNDFETKTLCIKVDIKLQIGIWTKKLASLKATLVQNFDPPSDRVTRL